MPEYPSGAYETPPGDEPGGDITREIRKAIAHAGENLRGVPSAMPLDANYSWPRITTDGIREKLEALHEEAAGYLGRVKGNMHRDITAGGKTAKKVRDTFTFVMAGSKSPDAAATLGHTDEVIRLLAAQDAAVERFKQHSEVLMRIIAMAGHTLAELEVDIMGLRGLAGDVADNAQQAADHAQTWGERL